MTLPPCPWCGGERVENAPSGRLICMECLELGGVQAGPVRATRPQVIAFIYAPARRQSPEAGSIAVAVHAPAPAFVEALDGSG